jgi:hypothetical protein
MTASFQLIDYSIRPAKFTERKMLCEVLARLKVFGSLEGYRYIGFGSIWFSDCVLFHRTLGIESIISIEREADYQPRFAFNNPYRGITLRMGDSAEILPALDWGQRNIVWLDYDDPLSPSILDDVRTIATRAGSGSALFVSVQAEKIFDKRNTDEDPIHVQTPELYRQLFGAARTPAGMANADLRGWTLSRTSRSAICQEIVEGLRQVNAQRPVDQRLEFRQVTAFEYADGAKITTVGGVFVNSADGSKFDNAGFGNLAFFSNGDRAFRIKVPLLTPREMRHLDRSLPCPPGAALDRGPIPDEEARRYALLYRYLPNFASYEL